MNLQTLDNIPSWEWPENAGEFIFNVLGEKNAPVSDRVLAAELAGDITVMNDKMAALLLAITEDSGEPEELRCKAPISLGPALEYGEMMEFDDFDDDMLSKKGFHEVQERLRSIYQNTDTPKKVRRRVLEAAVRAPMEWHKNAIQTAYASNDEEWVLTAVFCMGYVRGFDDQILESFKSENPDIFYEAVCAAGNSEVKAAWPTIKGLITKDDIDKPLLIAAINAAVGICPGEAVDILSELSDSDDEEIAEAVEDALAMAILLLDDQPEDEFF
ncbi:MAG: hypothetical protein GTN53_01615 [Candidatus Aminicenantes bacterium]|nr:hypothetical protein [Candidatus Aminicenantes bacterium]NIQ65188.1 hypothetical protein [Candidatus Aminicenantes bacterium]NIT21191.1 hypothetical protein [Candidatus Aminicenantes bacterium]